MLQWMGGSRRKVAANFKTNTSVKKRQKQYFEQRRWQQQLSESCSEGIKKTSSYQREHLSLDILSLLNLATYVPECKSSCPKDGLEDQEIDNSSLKYNTPRGSLTITGKTYTNILCETKGAGSSSSHKEEPVSENKTSFSLSDNHTNSLCGTKNRANVLRESTEKELSIFDLVGDDDPIVNLEENPESETHVAFSIEGLGKINTETPLHSPQQPDNMRHGRVYASRCSLPLKISSRAESSKNSYKHSDLENELDAFLESNDFIEGEIPFRIAAGRMAVERTRKQKLCTVRDYTHLPYTSDSGRTFHDIAEFDSGRVLNKYEWDARSIFSGCNFVGDEEDIMHWKDHWKDKQLWQMESVKADFLEYGNDRDDRVPGLTSAGHIRMKNREYMEATTRSNVPDSLVGRHEILERNKGYPRFSRMVHFNPGEKFDFGDVTDWPVWSPFLAEDENEAFSEESCSSSAAWANETISSQLNSRTRRRRRDLDPFCSAGDKICLNNSFAEELWEDGGGSQHGKRKEGSRKYVRLSNLGTSKATCHRYSSPPHGGLQAPCNRSVEGFVSTYSTLGTSYFPETSKMTLPASSPQPWCRYPSNAFLELSPSKASFGNMPKKASPRVSLDLELDRMHPGSSSMAGSTREARVPKWAVHGGSGNDEYIDSRCSPANFQFGVGQEICDGEDSELLADKGRKIDAIKSKDDKVRSKEVNDGIGHMGDPEAIQEQAEETSSSVNISENSNGRPVENEEAAEGPHKGNAG